MIRSCAPGRPIPLYGDGTNVRDWMHVEDHCRALDLALHRGRAGATYTLGGDCPLENREVVRRICAHFDRLRPDHAPHSRLVEHVTDRLGLDRRYAVDSTAAETELGWTRSWTFERGLAHAIDEVLGGHAALPSLGAAR